MSERYNNIRGPVEETDFVMLKVGKTREGEAARRMFEEAGVPYEIVNSYDRLPTAQYQGMSYPGLESILLLLDIFKEREQK